MSDLQNIKSEIEDLAVHCIRCGFCLEDCPTFKISGSELESPRGRIYLIRSAEEGVLDYKQVQPHLDHCLGCLACETACPSGVQYGRLMELAREKINDAMPRRAREKMVDVAVSKPALKASILASRLTGQARMPKFLSRMVSGVEAEVDTPSPQKGHFAHLNENQLPAVMGEVYLLKGCAMEVIFPRVHEASRRLLRRVGFAVKEGRQGCCGSMHAHQGFMETAKGFALQLLNDMADDIPVVVDSAGCGSTMKRYPEMLHSEESHKFSKRTFDISEFLLNHGLADQLTNQKGLLGKKVTYHDACHLVHGQKITDPPRQLISAVQGIECVPLEESDTCCGSAGVYNMLEPRIARALLDRKVENIRKTGAEIVILGNPGCHAWMAQGIREAFGDKVLVLHLAEFLEASFVGLP